MKKIIILTLAAALFPSLVLASSGEAYRLEADVDLTNEESLQRGAKYFVNYCMGCHSLNFMAYRRLGDDLGLDDEQVLENLVFVWDKKKKIAQYMTNSMPADQADDWFSVVPPDLSVIARARGADYLYTYLKTFYVDESRPLGYNNLAFPNASMPNPLWKLEGLKRAKFEEVTDEHGETHTKFVEFEQIEEGTLSAAEYDEVVRDLVNFLVYVGEPGQVEHRRLGVWVILFLVVLLGLVYAVKREYWKDVH